MIENPKTLAEQVLNLAERAAIELRALRNSLDSRVTAQGHVNSASVAEKADKLTTARNISLTGDASGSKSFDGSGDVEIPVTLKELHSSEYTYGPSGNATLAFAGTFTVPMITRDKKGRITTAKTITFTLPAVPESIAGNAASASKLQTSRNFSLTGKLSSTPVAFDGTGDVQLNVTSINIDDQLQTLIDGCASHINSVIEQRS